MRLSIAIRYLQLLKVLTTACLFTAGGLCYAQSKCEAVFAKAPSAPLDLAVDSPERTRWILDQNGVSNQSLKESPNTKPIEKWLRGVFDQPLDRSDDTISLADGKKVLFQRQSLDSWERVVLQGPLGRPRILAQLGKNEHAVSGVLSADERFLAVFVALNGSIDQVKILVFDLQDKKSPLKTSFDSDRSSLAWKRHKAYFKFQTSTFELDADTMRTRRIAGYYVGGDHDVLIFHDDSRFILSQPGGWTKLTPGFVPEKIIGKNEGFVYVKGSFRDDQTEIRRYALPLVPGEQAGERIISMLNTVVHSVTFVKDQIFIVDRLGKRQTMSVFSNSGKRLTRINAPLGLNFSETKSQQTRSKLSPDGKKVLVQLESDVLDHPEEFEYDIEKDSFTLSQEEILAKMMTVDGKEYETVFSGAISKDGAEIPYRITKLKDLALDGSHPILMKPYGAHGAGDAFYGGNTAFSVDFLSRGGIIVIPAARGGNEYGEKWHDDGRLRNKHHTFEDVIAVAEKLVTDKLTEPRKIILMGGSAGGLAVASSALLAPKAFGLVISNNGALDLLRKDELDPRTRGTWSYEYGDPKDPDNAEYLAGISPVELAKKATDDIPQFLLINGRVDTRVNSGHTFRLYAALMANHPDKVRMISTNNSGHWSYAPSYQGLIGWRSQVVIWTTIYDYLGWTRE